ncbi:hypothetical protein LC612_42690 [Nostoc sp. CHAB 5834]|nr:hypothetical protein [Nostoc sp. CHAB 5834]
MPLRILVYNTDSARLSPAGLGLYAWTGAAWSSIAAGGTAAEVGDIKTSMQTNDYDGGVKPYGRLKKSPTATQQARATALDTGADLPDATDAFLVQNGATLGSVAASHSKPLHKAIFQM